jgi:serine/threonine protein kinase
MNNNIQKMDSMIDKTIDNNNYQLVEELGQGSYGYLFLGQHLFTKNYVAIKVLSKKGLDNLQLSLQQLEIDIQLNLKHANILSLDHVVQEQDYIFMIMELCDGGDLFEYVVNNNNTSDDKEEMDIFKQIVDAIEYMHTNKIYHRDIKLENILLQSTTTTNASSDNKFICKVADFGLATRSRFSLEFGCGSTTYLAPEHFGSESEENTDEPYDAAASDIWSLGILLLALLFGRNPWEEATLMDHAFKQFIQDSNFLNELFPQLSNDCFYLLQQMLQLDPIKRCDIIIVKQLLTKMDHFTVEPLDIIPVKNNNSKKASYDSAIFSQDDDQHHSWFDMVEQDLAYSSMDYEHQEQDEHHVLVEDDDELFIHTQEKQSWWL